MHVLYVYVCLFVGTGSCIHLSLI